MKRVALATMGCKVNAYDSAHIRGTLDGSVRFVPFSEDADVYILNSCTVTNNSDREARNLLRRARRRNPAAQTIVTGCYAQTRPDELRGMAEVDYVVGNAEKGRIADIVRGLGAGFLPDAHPAELVTDVQALTEVRHVDAGFFEGQTRGYLKVQEGCLYRCSYCIIPYSRGGASRSVPLAAARAQAQSLAERGYRELVLTGVHIGSWGHEWDLELADLVEAVAEVDGIERVRISSIDSPELRPRLVELLAEHPRVARHAHVCLQSGSDGVLRRMARVYTAGEYRAAVESLVARNADICVGTDVIVGFPGETNAEFAETEALLATAPVHYFHVFTFSPRSGTPAAELPGTVHGEIARERSRRLRDLSAARKARWASAFVGRRMPVLFERDSAPDSSRGHAPNYLDVRVAARLSPGDIRQVEIRSVEAGKASGVVVP